MLAVELANTRISTAYAQKSPRSLLTTPNRNRWMDGASHCHQHALAFPLIPTTAACSRAAHDSAVVGFQKSLDSTKANYLV